MADAFPPKADAGVCPARAVVGDVSFGLTRILEVAQVLGLFFRLLKLLKSKAKKQSYVLC